MSSQRQPDEPAPRAQTGLPPARDDGVSTRRAVPFAAITPREASIVAALADAAAAPEAPLPPVSGTDAAAAFDAWLAAGPRRNRLALRAGLLALERASGRRRFRARDRAGRVAVLRRLQRARIPLLAQLTDALRTAAVVSYHGDARVMATLGYDAETRVRVRRARRAAAARAVPALPSSRAAALRLGPAFADGRAAAARQVPPVPAHGRGAAARRVTPAPAGSRGTAPASDVDGAALHSTRTLRADVCVIGTGAGGAVVAKESAEGGMRVLALEEGGSHPAATLTARPRDMLARLYRDGGQIATVGSPPILLPLGSGIGGTTLVNSGTCFRTPDHVLARWRRDFGLDALTLEALAPVFARVEATLGVAEVPAALAGANAAIIRRGAERLGWSGGYLHRNARGCQGSGVCAFGCPTGAKQHAGDAYLAPARAAGCVVCTGARAERFRMCGARAIAVEARTAAGGRLTVEADVFVVAAGTIHTPLLLAANGLARRGQLGRNLSLHPATAVWGVFDEPVDMTRGVPQSYFVDEFARSGIMLEGIAGPPDYLAMSAPLTGDDHRALMLRHRHVAQCGLMISDTARGRVRGRPGVPLIRYDLADADVATIHRGLVHVAELLQAAGAHTLHLPLAGLPTLPGADPAPLHALRLRRRDLKLMAFHPLGTARAHADPARGVVDPDLRLHDAENIYVADGSVVPSALGVNPQITIMALATRLAFHLRGATCPS